MTRKPSELLNMKVGDTFTAFIRIGQHVSAAKIFFDFTVTKVTGAGVVYADGVAHELRTDGLTFQGTKKRSARFRSHHEFQPSIKPGFIIGEPS